MKYYAILVGGNPGVFSKQSNWTKEILGYKNTKFRKFNSEIDALQYVAKGGKIENVFVDGSCRGHNNTHRIPSAGFGIYYGPDDNRNRAEPLESGTKPTTPQRAEFMAIIHALRNAHRALLDGTARSPVRILSDSPDCVHTYYKWGDKWKTNGWKKSKGGTIRNVDLIQEMLNLKEQINIHYASKGWSNIDVAHVKSHSGNLANNEAHRVANLGANQAEARIRSKCHVSSLVVTIGNRTDKSGEPFIPS
ncbi:uncharacterized protein J8A68_002320 [[Candida] subhashii]|uniref:RNase H type-1 domain-containing protein n=1 Tax=[Candida] subhashii TaxID=561895 RepID=A0A8J5QJC3_9ASCO|nr:uncharacterized protein J8A68_002320 [[Candida] subhashii]KAG7664137.1 hypothetical protein J8A68_002320 [[Candida] subhashii]